MKSSDHILNLVDRVQDRFSKLAEPEVSQYPAPAKWSKKEILGHLVDSASNNHQRFVRAQQVTELRFPVYKQVDWVKSQNYASENWDDILNLWIALNKHLAHIINQIPAEKLSVVCWLGDNQPITLGELIEDYIKHQEHHLKQIDAVFLDT
jgi:hypothetical protein